MAIVNKETESHNGSQLLIMRGDSIIMTMMLHGSIEGDTMVASGTAADLDRLQTALETNTVACETREY